MQEIGEDSVVAVLGAEGAARPGVGVEPALQGQGPQGVGRGEKAGARVDAVMNALDEPLRADFLTIPAVRWARRAIGWDKR